MNDFYEVLNQKFGIIPPTKYDQDWQWTCGNPSQTEGYISFYHDYADSMSDDQKSVVINMIIQGYEDILRQNTSVDTADIWDKIENILVSDKHIHAETIRYWASLSTTIVDSWTVSAFMRKLVKELDLEWNIIQTDDDIEYLNNIYDFFEDSMIVSMNYISGNSVDKDLVGNMQQDNNLSILFQRLDENPFSIELFFTHTKQIKFHFNNPSDGYLSDIMKAKVCRNDKSVFWTMWDEFDPNNEEHKLLQDVIFVEAEGLKWRFVLD